MLLKHITPRTPVKTTGYIATTAPAAPLPAPTPDAGLVEQWGLQSAVVLLLLKEGWAFLKKGQETQNSLMIKKEDNESNLINTLVASLKDNQTALQQKQSDLIAQLVSIQKQSHEDIRELKEAVLTMGTTVRKELHDSLAQQTELQIKKSESLIAINEKLDAMNQRLNLVEVKADVLPCRHTPKSKAPQVGEL